MACIVLAFLYDMFVGAGLFATLAAGFFCWDKPLVVFSQVGMSCPALDESAECFSVSHVEPLCGFREGGSLFACWNPELGGFWVLVHLCFQASSSSLLRKAAMYACDL